MNYYNPLKVLVAAIILLFSTKGETFTPGHSAWLYGKNQSWVYKISAFNKTMPATCRINYLFPEAGTIHIDSTNKKIILDYDASVSKFYKTNLPDVKIMPDISFWVAHTNFKNWTPEQYQTAAITIAAYINQDKNADGVFLDLESYKTSLLPFYRDLVNSLKNKHKLISVIVRPGQENIAWFKTLGSRAFVVLYGYDLHHQNDANIPVSPEVYQNRLRLALNNLIKIANITHTPIIGGLPVIATTYEWEHKNTTLNDSPITLHSKFKQVDYLKSALDVYNSSRSPLVLGFSIWAFVNDTKSTRTYLPNLIDNQSWALLTEQQHPK